MKTFIPPAWRINVRVLQRYLKDLSTGRSHQLAMGRAIDAASKSEFYPQIALTQPLGSISTQYFGNKKHNLGLAIQKLQDVVVAPGQVFSFWHLVGNPTAAAGYVSGRTIMGQTLATTVGGGLCQLSGLVYFLALKSGLTIIERHSHSKDIYTDATRFAPLGSDATVVYGYKDLRFQNNLSSSICFRFLIREQDITTYICSDQPIVEARIEFCSESLDSGTQVETIRYTPAIAKGEVVSSDFYPKILVPSSLQ
jgi:vancomycin resistance protein VanW